MPLGNRLLERHFRHGDGVVLGNFIIHDLFRRHDLFGGHLSVADAMFAPVCTRFATYDVALDPVSDAYKHSMLATADMRAWRDAALLEPEEVTELEVEVEF